MITLRDGVYTMALVGVLAVLIWGMDQKIELAKKKIELVTATAAADAARKDANRNLATVNTLKITLQQERESQSALRAQQDQLRQALAKRARTIEELKRENDELRDWAARPLPDAARRLRERPALTGAAAYRDWLSGRGAVPAAGDKPSQ